MSLEPRSHRPEVATLRVGTDILDVRNVAESIHAFGERYLVRVFTRHEREYCASIANEGGDSVPHLAARFAAKEAVMKVLRPGPSDVLTWKSIEVVRNPDGSCAVRLHGRARALARRAGLSAFAVSLSHERRYVMAVAIAEQTSNRKATVAALMARRPVFQ
jgi:holo-[acyl-carrier protein] synthase